MNELSMIFNKLEINMRMYWLLQNKVEFLYTGLAGGHCIGVDPYYITHKAEMVGYNPQVILAGRQINDNMPAFAQQTLKQMIKANIRISMQKLASWALRLKIVLILEIQKWLTSLRSLITVVTSQFMI